MLDLCKPTYDCMTVCNYIYIMISAIIQDYIIMHYFIIGTLLVSGKTRPKIITYLHKKFNELNIVILLNFNFEGLPV